MLFLCHYRLSIDERCWFKAFLLLAVCDGTPMNLRALGNVTRILVIRSRVSRSNTGCWWRTRWWKSRNHYDWSVWSKLGVVCVRESSSIVHNLNRFFFAKQLVELIILLLDVSLHKFLLLGVEIVAGGIHELQIIVTFAATAWSILIITHHGLLLVGLIEGARDLLVIQMLPNRHFVHLFVIGSHFFSQLLPFQGGQKVD